jgi:hypothetical protein
MTNEQEFEVVTDPRTGQTAVLAEVEPWMEELFPRDPLAFRLCPLEYLPFRYVGNLASAQGLLVICSASRERDGKRWIHVSMSRHKRLPSYDDMCLVKNQFLGANRLAVQVFARAAHHVNINPHVLHLWSCLDGDPVPDFRHEGQI